MSGVKEDGGHAFPLNVPPFPPVAGMTLRDYFAAKAMAAIISKLPVSKNDEGDRYSKAASVGAYGYADAMLEARK